MNSIETFVLDNQFTHPRTFTKLSPLFRRKVVFSDILSSLRVTEAITLVQGYEGNKFALFIDTLEDKIEKYAELLRIEKVLKSIPLNEKELLFKNSKFVKDNTDSIKKANPIVKYFYEHNELLNDISYVKTLDNVINYQLDSSEYLLDVLPLHDFYHIPETALIDDYLFRYRLFTAPADTIQHLRMNLVVPSKNGFDDFDTVKSYAASFSNNLTVDEIERAKFDYINEHLSLHGFDVKELSIKHLSALESQYKSMQDFVNKESRSDAGEQDIQLNKIFKRWSKVLNSESFNKEFKMLNTRAANLSKRLSTAKLDYMSALDFANKYEKLVNENNYGVLPSKLGSTKDTFLERYMRLAASLQNKDNELFFIDNFYIKK